MKKGTIVCIVSVSLIGVGIIISSIGFALGGRVSGIGWSDGVLQVHGAKGINDVKRSVYVDIDEELGEFKQMQVDMEYGDFTIEPSDHYGISYHGSEGDFTYQVKDGKLVLSQVIENYSGNGFFFFDISIVSDYIYEQEYATVYVPENAVFESVSIKNNGGNVDISNISAGDLQIEADYGNVLLSNIKGEDYTVTMESGKAEIESISGNSLNLSNAYGEVTLEEVALKNEAEIYAESGNIELNDVNIPNLTAESDYGDITGKMVSVRQAELRLESGECKLRKLDTDNIKVESSYGDVELDLIQLLDDFSYDLYTDYGELYVSDKKMGSQYESLQDDKEKKISINCESGDIEIKQAE